MNKEFKEILDSQGIIKASGLMKNKSHSDCLPIYIKFIEPALDVYYRAFSDSAPRELFDAIKQNSVTEDLLSSCQEAIDHAGSVAATKEGSNFKYSMLCYAASSAANAILESVNNHECAAAKANKALHFLSLAKGYEAFSDSISNYFESEEGSINYLDDGGMDVKINSSSQDQRLARKALLVKERMTHNKSTMMNAKQKLWKDVEPDLLELFKT